MLAGLADNNHVTKICQRNFVNRFCETCCSFHKPEIICPMTINKTDKGTYTNAKIQIDGESNSSLVEKQRRSLRDSMAKVKSK